MTREGQAAAVDPSRYGKVAVLMGGWAAEREVSLESGGAVLAALRRAGVDAHGIDAGRDVLDRLREGDFDRVFVALHGRGGEDGVVQGALETLGIPYTGSGVLGSALGMDKRRTKMLWSAAGVPTPPARVVTGEAELVAVQEEIGLPVMVKPVHEGSSLGMARADTLGELRDAWRAAAAFDREVMAERWVEGLEYTASILAEQVLPLIRLETHRGFYDYEAKYADADTRYICPCGLDAATEEALQATALGAFRAVGASGWGRVDFLLDPDGNPWFIEVNTVPGMTSHSLVPMAAAAAGMGFDALVMRILDTAGDCEVAGRIERHGRRGGR